MHGRETRRKLPPGGKHNYQQGGIKMKTLTKLSLAVALALMLVPYCYANEWVPADTLQQLRTLLQSGASGPKVTVAAPIIGAQVTGTQASKTTLRREISLDDQRGNDWWSVPPTILAEE